MNSEILTFQNEQFGQIRTMIIEGEPWFVAIDVCTALSINNNREAVKRLDDDERNTVSSTDGIRGNPEKTIVNESGLYSLVLSSRKPEARAFRRWITHEVIPSIRKHGAYIVPELLDALNKNEEERQRLLNDLIADREAMNRLIGEKEELQGAIDEARPKVNYYDSVLQNPTTLPVVLIAKDYGFSAVRFNTLLRKLGIQYKVGKTWVLYQDYADNGYVHYNVYRRGKKAISHMVWTQKGRLFLYDFLKGKGILPKIETEDQGEVIRKDTNEA